MPGRPADQDPLAREVDRLLRQLPGADPSLQTDPDQPAPSAQRPMTTGPRPAVGRPRPAGPTPLQRWGVWARVVGAVLVGGALTQWPYRADCGWALYGYLAAVAAVLVTAGWAAVAAWRIRSGAAHALALVAGFWGVVLAAEQILPRVGYAAETRAWQCRAVLPAPPRAVAPSPPAVATDSAVADTVTGAPADSSLRGS